MYLKLLTTDSATNTTNGILILIMLLICAAGIYCFYRLIKRSKQNEQYIEESGYKVTDELGDLKVDKNKSVWWVKNYFGEPKIHNFNEVIDYELVVNDNTVKGKGAFSRAVAGGLLFGGVGAVAGASTAKRVTVVTALYINVYLKDGTLERINFINTATKADSFTYNTMKDCAEKASALFTAMIADNESKNASSASAISAADEIAKYKKLLDDGTITEEEYNALKAEGQQISDDMKAKRDALAEMYGWNKDDDEREASKKGFASMSQDSADKLDGAFAVMTSHTYSINEGVKQIQLSTDKIIEKLVYLSSMDKNIGEMMKHSDLVITYLSDISSHTARLEAIEKAIESIRMGIDTLNTKGITLKR